MIERTHPDHAQLRYAGLFGHEYVAVHPKHGLSFEGHSFAEAKRWGGSDANVYKRTPLPAGCPCDARPWTQVYE